MASHKETKTFDKSLLIILHIGQYVFMIWSIQINNGDVWRQGTSFDSMEDVVKYLGMWNILQIDDFDFAFDYTWYLSLYLHVDKILWSNCFHPKVRKSQWNHKKKWVNNELLGHKLIVDWHHENLHKISLRYQV